jgi:hypothetical protein
MSDTSESAQNPETFATQRLKLEHRAKYALREGGVDIPSKGLVTAVVDLLIDERSEVRDFCDKFAETLAGRDDNFTSEQLERLAYILRFGFEDDDGEIRISFADSEER